MDNQNKASILYIITQNEMGGAQRYVLDLARSLSEAHNISVAFGENKKNKIFSELLEKNNIKYYEIPELKRSISLKDDIRALKALRKFIKTLSPDFVHLNSSKVSVLGSLACIGLKTSVVYTAHGWVFNENLGTAKKKSYIRAEKFSAVFKDKIICVSEFDRQTAIKNKICSKNKLITIHNGIGDFELYSRQDARDYLVKKIGNPEIFSKHDFVIGSIGHLYKNKGYDYLINSIRSLQNKNINPLLLVIGKGSEMADLSDFIAQLNLEDNVILLGEIENASRLLKAFDIYVCSSLKEGLSYTIIEAMTAGLPIIATKVGGNPELIENEKEGLLINPADKEEIAGAVLHMLEDTSKTSELAELAQRKAMASFNIEQMIQKTKYVYDSLL